jgi:hypothetical protein
MDLLTKSFEIVDSVEELVRMMVWAKENESIECESVVGDSRERLAQAINDLWS